MALTADFHIHSCLSPCGSLDLSPRTIAELAGLRGIKVLALTDHNSSLNCPAFAKTCRKKGIIPIFGMEATTREEIHILCLFTSLEACMSFNEHAYSLLMPFPNNPEKTGDQVYVDEDDNIQGEVEYYLINPLDLSVNEIGGKVSEYGGIVIPAHVERPAFSMHSQLGAIIDGPWAALECTRIPPMVDSQILDTLGFPLTVSSDAHYPEHLGRRTFELDTSFEELAPGGLLCDANIKVLVQALGKRPRFR